MHVVKVIAWFWPFSATPCDRSGIEFEVNGFEGEYNGDSDLHVTNNDS